MSKICILSDLHESWSAHSDTSSGLEGFLVFAYNNYDLVIFNGDMMQNGNRFMQTLARHHLLLSYIDKRKTIFIEGNHDEGVSCLNGKFGYTILKELLIDDMLIIHGHQIDLLYKKRNWFASAILNIRDMIEPSFDIIDELPGRIANYEEYLVKMGQYAVKRKADEVIFGHTHRAGYFLSNGRDIVTETDGVGTGGIVLINQGCWVNGRRDYVSIIDDKIEIRNYR